MQLFLKVSPKQSLKFSDRKTQFPEFILPNDLKYDVMPSKWEEILEEEVVDHPGEQDTVVLTALFHGKAVKILLLWLEGKLPKSK